MQIVSDALCVGKCLQYYPILHIHHFEIVWLYCFPQSEWLGTLPGKAFLDDVKEKVHCVVFENTQQILLVLTADSPADVFSDVTATKVSTCLTAIHKSILGKGNHNLYILQVCSS